MESDSPHVKLRRSHSPAHLFNSNPEITNTLEQSKDGSLDSTNDAVKRRIRPRSASYAALRSAVFKLTSLSDFTMEKIGSGFFADVYKVKDKVSEEVMVLKMNKSRKTSKQMLSEIQLMNRLSHPNVLKFKGSCVSEGQLHALTEYINGGSLEELLQNISIDLSLSVKVRIALDIARGMTYLHSRGVFHRDLNTRNCLIQILPDGRFHTVVADFGLAAQIKQRRRKNHTETVGSPYSMAPECLTGKSYCEQADVFSYGITLAEIITRMPADPEFIPRTSCYGVNFEALREFCVGCPEELFQVMYRCCQMDPDDRPCFEEVQKSLETIPINSNPQVQSENHFERPSSPVAAMVDDDRNLRSCVSEPLLGLTDPDMDNRSCDSEGDIKKYIGNRLDSLGSSTASIESSCSSLYDDSKHALPGIAEMPASSQFAQTKNVPAVSHIATVTLEGPHSNHDLVDTDQINRKYLHDKATEVLNTPQNCTDRSYPHNQLHKSKSLTLSDESTKTSSEHKTLQQTSTDLNSSLSTLVSNEDTSRDSKELTNGGGDSGIDPGEIEVFKFPPRSEISSETIDSNSEDQVIKATDKEVQRVSEGSGPTPLCANTTQNDLSKTLSANTTPAAYSVCGYDLSPLITPMEVTPPPSRFRLSRILSNDSELGIHERPSSPFTQSWASSECSFYLPTPSTPYAPPSTPVMPLRSTISCPSSPTFLIEQFSQERILNDFSLLDSDSPMHPQRRISTPTFRVTSKRNSYVDYINMPFELDSLAPPKETGKVGANNPKRRSVHFPESEDQLCTNFDQDNFSKPSTRTRSQSNPARPSIIKSGTVYSLTLARQSSPGSDPSVVGAGHKNTRQCKGYNITLKTNARLSSSLPNLFRFSSIP